MAARLPDKNEPVTISSNTVICKCPVCRQIPKAEVFQCPKGHSFCLFCILDRKTCPVCNIKIYGYKLGLYGVRNYLAESLLDQMKFECRWKDHGCQTLITRSKISEHENSCIYGYNHNHWYLSIHKI